MSRINNTRSKTSDFRSELFTVTQHNTVTTCKDTGDVTPTAHYHTLYLLEDI